MDYTYLAVSVKLGGDLVFTPSVGHTCRQLLIIVFAIIFEGGSILTTTV